MDPRRLQQNLVVANGQPQAQQGQRFSWQLPAESGSSGSQAIPQPVQPSATQAIQNGYRLPEPQQSWTGHSAEIPATHNWPGAFHNVPREPTIPQSPTQSATTSAHWDGPSFQSPRGAGDASQAKGESIHSPGLPPYVDRNMALSSSNVPPVAYMSPHEPLAAQKQDQKLTEHNPVSPSGMVPVLMSTSDSEQPRYPIMTQSTSPMMTYTPHAATARHNFASNPNARSDLPYAPDDLFRTHTAAAVEQGRLPALPFSGSTNANPGAHQPGQTWHPNMKTKEEGRKAGWKHSLTSCGSDVDTCCLGFSCPCILHSRTSYRLAARSEKRDSTDLLGFKSCNGTCVMMGFTMCFGFMFPSITRTRIRHHYNIEGGAGSDFCTSCACCCCVVVQNEREVRDQEESRRRWAGPATGAATQYAAPSNEMRYAPAGGHNV